MRNLHLIYFVISFIILSTSCKTRKDLVYFQDSTHLDSISTKNYSTVLRTGDLLSVDVYGIDEELMKIFNQNFVSTNQLPTYNNGIAPRTGYSIDDLGNINLPEIGAVKIVGLTLMEATQVLTSRLSVIASNAKVMLRIQNFRITVLGDVKTPGTYTIPNERITILEALGIAGDLNITGVRKNILVIRDENGIKKEYRVDLTSKDLFKEDVYYLTQNDVIYVEPNRAKRNSSIISSTATVFVSIVSLVITTINIITK